MLFIYLRENENTSGAGGREEQQRGRKKQALHGVGSPRQNSIPGCWDHDLS